MRIAAELRDYEAAGSLAEELPYWGWLEDSRTCLTRTGELIAAGRLAPAVVDGRSPEQIDRVLGRWQRLLSGLDSDTRLYFYMLRRPSPPEAADDEGSGIVAVSQRKRRAFLSGRVQQLEAYLVWSHDPRLRAVADGPTSGSASRLMQWWKRRRASAPTYLSSEIEAAAARFRATVDAGRALVGEHTPIEMLSPAEASWLLSELINRLLHIDSNTIHMCLIRFFNYSYRSELCRTFPVALSLCVHYVPVYNIRYFIRGLPNWICPNTEAGDRITHSARPSCAAPSPDTTAMGTASICAWTDRARADGSSVCGSRVETARWGSGATSWYRWPRRARRHS